MFQCQLYLWITIVSLMMCQLAYSQSDTVTITDHVFVTQSNKSSQTQADSAFNAGNMTLPIPLASVNSVGSSGCENRDSRLSESCCNNAMGLRGVDGCAGQCDCSSAQGCRGSNQNGCGCRRWTGCDSLVKFGCNSCCCGQRERYRLLDQDNPWGLVLEGWFNGGIMINTEDNNGRNDPVAFSNPAGEFLGNQAWMGLGKEVDTGGYGWDWGFRVDAVYGADGPDTQSFGDGSWDFGWNTSGEYGTAIPQIYGEIGLNDLKVKVGHFYTIMGYEVVQAPGNFFYSHSYNMTYGEPFTHTGALAEYTTGKGNTVYAGYTFGWDAGFENQGDAHSFLGGLSRTLNSFAKLKQTISVGDFGNGLGPSGNQGNIYSTNSVLEVALTEGWNYVLQYDYSYNMVGGSSPAFPGGPVNKNSAEWYGITQYLFYDVNDCWQFGTRLEWFDDSDGLRIATVNDGLNDLHYWELTLGANYKPTPNFIVRPEVRFDWSTSHSDGDFNDVFVNNTADNLQVFGIDFILLY